MRLILASLFAATAILFTGCGFGEQCSEPNHCAHGGSWQACCTPFQCKYTLSDGSEIECNGTDCSTGVPSAAEEVADWCVG